MFLGSDTATLSLRHLPGNAARILLLAGLTFVLASLAISITQDEGRIAAIWPINAIFMIALLKSARPLWGVSLIGFAAGLLAANITAGDTITRAALLTLANTLEVTIASVVFSYKARPKLISFSGVLKLFSAALVACIVSTSVAAAGLALTGITIPAREAALWFAADMLGIVLFVPVLWSISIRSVRFRLRPDWRFAGELLLVCAVTFGVFTQSQYPFLFLVPPVVVIPAFSNGVKGAAYGLLAITAIALPYTLADSGPTSLMQTDMIAKVLVLQVFLAANSVLAFSVGAVVSDRSRLILQLKRSTEHLKGRARLQRELIGKAHLAEQMSGVGHWSLDPATSKVYWSPEVYAIHGVSSETFDPNYGDAIAFYADEDRSMVEQLVQRGIANGEGWEFEATLITKQGTRRLVRSIGECLKDRSGNTEQIIGVFKDITEEKRVYEELAAREQEYRLLAEHATDIVLKFDLDGTVTYVSPSCKILGIRPEDAIGKSALEFVIPEDREFASRVIRDLLSGAGRERWHRREHRAPSADGGIIWLEGNPSIIRDELGAPIGIVSTYRDVTDRREREDALAAARLEAEAATEAKTEFLSNMSHEIRTPLNGILGFTKLVSETELTPEQADYLGNIRSAGVMLREIVDDILDFSKVEAGKLELDNQPFSLNDAIKDVTRLVDAGRKNKSVTISHQIHSDEPLRIIADETRLRQILTNLVGNAAKFTQKGRIDVSAKVFGDCISIAVSDTGRGIPADKLERVFEGFRQADSTVTRRFGGSGLGLSISRSLAHLMGGDLTLESVVGEGTTVKLTIPYVPAKPGTCEEPALSEGNDRTEEVPGRILVIDDVEMNLSLIRHGLKHTKYEVETYTSAKSALKLLRSGAQFDLVFMDVQMPDMDGLTATHLIRKMSGPIRSVPIVAMTAHALPSHIRQCLDAGMNEHFPKPVDLDKMKELIRQMLQSNDRAPSEGNPEDEGDPLAPLRAQYKVYLASVAKEFDDVIERTGDEEMARSVAALAHAIAGTAGSFGFSDVSDAAFALENLALQQVDLNDPDLKTLRKEVDQFIRISKNAAAA